MIQLLHSQYKKKGTVKHLTSQGWLTVCWHHQVLVAVHFLDVHHVQNGHGLELLHYQIHVGESCNMALTFQVSTGDNTCTPALASTHQHQHSTYNQHICTTNICPKDPDTKKSRAYLSTLVVITSSTFIVIIITVALTLVMRRVCWDSCTSCLKRAWALTLVM
jgi:hypothetical protein